ncbi:MAG: ATP-dependent DNA helicase [Actinomycetota bacterium]|nr:ATP-dependent DNA helicase [Actinomycetota bacterium]
MQWRLDLAPVPPAAPAELDADQRRVVEHRHGPLLVLAGPGTGKTTTIVESMCARLGDDADPLDAASVLALTFGRKAATELRERVTHRLGGGIVPTVATFHSFAYALLRRFAPPDEYLHPPRLMSGAEEDVRIRELLRGAVADGTVDWPDDLMGALPTLGLANEVRSVLARARDLGMEEDRLRRVGEASGRPAWVAIGQLATQEQEVMALENVMDYAELLWRAWLLARDPEVSAVLHRQYRAIYVDEYQDTDPLQVDLLKALVGPDCSIVAVGDPDQAIYAFRGADVGGLLRFPDDFRAPSGDPAPVAVLREARRFGPVIRAAAGSVLGRMTPRSIPAALMAQHRAPTCAPRPAGSDVVAVHEYDHEGSLAAHVAHGIRLAHVQRGVPWTQMAVLVRSGRQIPPLQRALSASGVPVVVAADEIPLRSEPAVAALLGALHVATSPASASATEVLDLLTGPVVGLSGTDLRRLGRALRQQAHAAGYASPPSDDLIRDLVVRDLAPPLPADDPVMVAVDRLRCLLAQVHDRMVAGDAPGEVIWTLWTGGTVPHGWPARLRAAALAGSRSAGHDLDAVTALFDAAERLSDRYPGFAGIRMFLDSLAVQEIPAEPVADRGTDADAVRILTAHRAKGLEWDEVWVVGAQEGVWPDLRQRGSTLHAEELAADGVGDGLRPADLLDEERRLFYVACTRARLRLHVAAVSEPGDGGERPSRFVADLLGGLAAAGHAVATGTVHGRPPHPLTLDGLVAELRQVAQDPDTPGALRTAAVERLAVLAAQRDEDGEPLVPLADPSAWWGLRAPTVGVRPVRDPDSPLYLSGSGLDSVLDCPLKWFLEREVHAETPRGTATAFGSVVHAVADFVAKGDLPADLEAMDAEVDRIWSELRFEAAWQSQSERREARAALARFLAYHLREERSLLATESSVGVTVTVPTAAGTDEVRLTGFIDRVEQDDEGRLVPIDLKNMRRPHSDKDVPEHGQLGVYQLILREGGLTATREEPGEPREVGGAALVQLRAPEGKGSDAAKVQFQPALEAGPDGGPSWVEVRLGEAADVLRREAFDAVPGPACRYCSYASTCPTQPRGQQVLP